MIQYMSYKQFEYIEWLVNDQFGLNEYQMRKFWREYRTMYHKVKSDMTMNDASELIEKLKSDKQFLELMSNRLVGSLD